MTRSQIGLKSGSKAIGASLWSGVKGVVTTPVNEVKKKGAIGLLTGTMKGVSGLVVKPETVREYGYVHRIQRSNSDETECFVQDNFYYLCDAEKEIAAQKLDGYEREEAYTLEVVPPEIAIEKNRSVGKTPYAQEMFEREARVLECVMADGLFD